MVWPRLGPYNSQKLVIFLDCFYSDLIPANEGPPHTVTNYVIVWDNVISLLTWFTTQSKHGLVGGVLLRSSSLPGGGKCMSIRYKVRGACSMQWTLCVKILQEISVGDGCDIPLLHCKGEYTL